MENKVFDPLRKKYVSLTPEEQVRQYFINWLSTNKKYPLSLMASEYHLKFNKLNYRCDIVVFNRDLSPYMIVECKAPSIKLNADVIDQVLRYNLVLKVKILVITNGLTTFAFCFDDNIGKYLPINDIYSYTE